MQRDTAQTRTSDPCSNLAAAIKRTDLCDFVRQERTIGGSYSPVNKNGCKKLTRKKHIKTPRIRNHMEKRVSGKEKDFPYAKPPCVVRSICRNL